MTDALVPERGQMETFVREIFRYAGDTGYVSMRSFYDGENELFRKGSVALSGGLQRLVDVAMTEAQYAARQQRPVVFCPPLVVLNNPDQAREEDLELGLVLTVDCDTRPLASRTKLEELLGPTTLVNASGGEWINEATGEIEPKLHLHWRLKVPTTTPEQHALLKEARQLMAKLVRSDRTAGPVIHPLRWPGSWHRKGEPRLARIIATSDNEIDLHEALAVLRDTVGTLETREANHGPRQLLADDQSMVPEKLAGIPNDANKPLEHDYTYWRDVGLATFGASGGSTDGLTWFHQWSAKNVAKYNVANTDKRWRDMKRSPPNRIGYGTLHHLAWQHYLTTVPPMPEELRALVAGDRGKGTTYDRPRGFNDAVDEQLASAPVDDTPREQSAPATPRPVILDKPYVLVRASDVVMRAQRWLWKGHLLRGTLELLTGLPGIGKSQVQCHLIACATTGRQWPDGAVNEEPCDVVMVTAEDTLDQAVVPRLRAANADITKVHILKAIKKDRKERMFLLAEDLLTLSYVIEDVGHVGLVTLDPITAYMGKVDSHRATDVRGQLGPLKDFAETKDVAFSAITHPAKAASQKAIDHFIGSQAFIAAARIGHLCIEEQDEEAKLTGRILFTHAKTNVSVKMPTLAYRIATLAVGQDQQSRETIVAPHVVWDREPVGITADQALAASSARPEDGAVKLLKELLERGPVSAKVVAEQAAGQGLTMKQMHRAKSKLGVVAERQPDQSWLWKRGRLTPPATAGADRPPDDCPF